MSKLVFYSTIGGKVSQWFDGDMYEPPVLTPENGLSILAVTEEEWLAQTDPMWVIDGVLTTVQPPPTPAEVLASQSLKLQQFTQLANAQKVALTARISTLQDAIDLEMATPEEVAELPVRQAQLLEWKRYAVYLGRVTTQEGWPPDVVWPVQPAEGMDLTVSAVAPDSPQLQ